jgi:hypothetical protein
MLAAVSGRLLREGWTTSVVARRADGLARLAAGHAAVAGALHGISVDYRDTDAFIRTVEDSSARAGPISLAVVWIQAVAPDAPAALAAALTQHGARCRYVHVLGSAAADPATSQTARRRAFERFPGLRYEEVVLGFVVEGDQARWLTNAEIAAGVNRAIDTGHERSVVGQVEPWSAAPR